MINQEQKTGKTTYDHNTRLLSDYTFQKAFKSDIKPHLESILKSKSPILFQEPSEYQDMQLGIDGFLTYTSQQNIIAKLPIGIRVKSSGDGIWLRNTEVKKCLNNNFQPKLYIFLLSNINKIYIISGAWIQFHIQQLQKNGINTLQNQSYIIEKDQIDLKYMSVLDYQFFDPKTQAKDIRSMLAAIKNGSFNSTYQK